MRERPILFSGPMVRAILAGHKTQTRRVVKTPVHFIGGRGQEDDPSCWGWAFEGPTSDGYMVLERDLNEQCDHGLVSIPCPHGEIGDRLWVKETFCPRYFDDGKPGYRADWDPDLRDLVPEPKWKSSMFMPRSLSRITLEITNVRVQRLQEIDNNDALAEGTPDIRTKENNYDMRDCFAVLWDSINKKKYPWLSNLFVWAISFRRI